MIGLLFMWVVSRVICGCCSVVSDIGLMLLVGCSLVR